MSLFTRLGEKSWETPGSDRPDPATYRPPAAQVMMLVYFGVITILFGLVSSAYFMRMGMPGMGHAAMDWRPMPEPPLIWINTAVLLLASLAWEAARIGTRRGETALVRPGLIAAGALGVLFLGGQLLLWSQFATQGYFLQSNPANAFFYMITTLHGLHLIGGLWFWGLAMRRARGGGAAALPIQLTAAYWHFLLLVWILMLGLFVST
ncbi:cytochrome c oxidase subunit 3 [Allosphingosinicella sp.]|uniref:cytochrome c oxidase subunit 3 n=1 Tax=Allosphingosinicella sp. TaxID=2823234 RepID=UPI002FC1E19C